MWAQFYGGFAKLYNRIIYKDGRYMPKTITRKSKYKVVTDEFQRILDALEALRISTGKMAA